ncbi:hypothetical protein [Rubrobacter aplysinae]|uniref:hypothetical protein n=1 Tax=Rubrobacter aplysinae TaxID=909625 RepID=UPI00064C26D2|nr:hypothetical protein [Rubrobacter aplysinae]
MDLEALHGGSFVHWERVAGSWSKRTVSSRLLLFAARHYLAAVGDAAPDPERQELLEGAPLPKEVKDAFTRPPQAPGDERDRLWGEFVDAAVVAELDVISYGERPPLLHELRNGLEAAAEEAGPQTPLGRWLTSRREALPGSDLPDDPEFVPV